MTATVHILATVRKPELLRAALLVFQTLRVGFPTAHVCVWGNGLDAASAEAVSNVATFAGGKFCNLPATVHDVWLENLIARSTAPFWILDTDVVFHSNAEDFALGDCVFAGRLEPEFDDEFTRCRHVERLHTCVMYLDPARVRAASVAVMDKFPDPFRVTCEHPLLRMTRVPVRRGQSLCYDTTAGLWQAGYGTPFTPKQNDAFSHIHCGTYIDLIKVDSLADLKAAHAMVYADPQRSRGMLAVQTKFYETRKPEVKS